MLRETPGGTGRQRTRLDFWVQREPVEHVLSERGEEAQSHGWLSVDTCSTSLACPSWPHKGLFGYAENDGSACYNTCCGDGSDGHIDMNTEHPMLTR